MEYIIFFSQFLELFCFSANDGKLTFETILVIYFSIPNLSFFTLVSWKIMKNFRVSNKSNYRIGQYQIQKKWFRGNFEKISIQKNILNTWLLFRETLDSEKKKRIFLRLSKNFARVIWMKLCNVIGKNFCRVIEIKLFKLQMMTPDYIGMEMAWFVISKKQVSWLKGIKFENQWLSNLRSYRNNCRVMWQKFIKL